MSVENPASDNDEGAVSIPINFYCNKLSFYRFNSSYINLYKPPYWWTSTKRNFSKSQYGVND